MNITRAQYLLRQQHGAGYSLIELMIALVIGMLLVAGATQILFANNRAFHVQQNVSTAQEAGRLAIEMMEADLRLTGGGISMDKGDGAVPVYVTTPNVATGSMPAIAVLGVDAQATKTSIAGLLTDSDSLQVSYAVPACAMLSMTPATCVANTVVMSDCEGNGAQATDIISNRYFVAIDANPDIPALFCDGKVFAATGLLRTEGSANGVALLRGVESFQVQYGIRTVKTAGAGTALQDTSVNGYGSAEQYVTAAALASNNTQGTQVTALRIGLLVRTEHGIEGLKAASSPKDIPVLDQVVTAASWSDVKVNAQYPMHRAFVSTIALRNNARARQP